jgi:uncharacterized protein
VTLYLDTSAIVKLYNAELGSAETRRAVADAEQVVCSLLAYSETRAALARKHRLGQIDAELFARSKAEFEFDWNGVFVMPIDSRALRGAADLAEQFDLRAFDAIHLEAASRLGRETASRVRFVCFDRALNRAASNLGLLVE